MELAHHLETKTLASKTKAQHSIVMLAHGDKYEGENYSRKGEGSAWRRRDVFYNLKKGGQEGITNTDSSLGGGR